MNTEAERWIVIAGLESGFIILSLLTTGAVFFLYTGRLGRHQVRGLFLIASIVILIMRELWRKETRRPGFG